MISKTIGGGAIRGVHPSVDNPRNSNLPHPVVPTCQYPDMLNHYPPDILVHSTSTAPRPVTSTIHGIPTSANNWQEQSFDSSIVTDSHYDASFESEIPPMRLSIDGGVGQHVGNNSELMPTNQVGGVVMPNTSSIKNAVPLTTSQRAQKNVFQQRKGASLPQSGLANNVHSELGGSNAKGSGMFGIAGYGQNSAGEKNSLVNMLQPLTNQGIGGSKTSASDVTVSNPHSSSNPA